MAFADGSAIECITLKAFFVMQILLQKPSQKGKSKVHVVHLKRRLNLWKQGEIASLVHEGRYIQRYLLSRLRPSDDDAIAQNFGKMMEQGKVRNALQYLSRNTTGGVFSLDDKILLVCPILSCYCDQPNNVLQDKHSPGHPADPSSLLPSSLKLHLFNPIIFDNLNTDSIQRAATECSPRYSCQRFLEHRPRRSF